MVLLLGVVAWLSMGMYIGREAAAFEQKAYTVIEDVPYYFETTYYLDAKELFSRNSEAATSVAKLVYEKWACFVAGIKKRVAVEEKYSNGIITESRLLTREEIHEGQAGVQTIYPVVGMDNMSKYFLEIEMYVLFNPSTDVCSVYGTATWDTQVILGGEEYPDAGADDFMVLNWGGAGELKAASRSFSGVYWDGTDIEYSLNIQNAYQGYSWQFREKAGSFGSCMHWANVTADLVKTYPEKQGRETNIQFTYVHTYGSITPTIGISAGYPSGVAGSINVSSTDKVWQIMVDVPGITY